jgi:hypothetical protein
VGCENFENAGIKREEQHRMPLKEQSELAVYVEAERIRFVKVMTAPAQLPEGSKAKPAWAFS